LILSIEEPLMMESQAGQPERLEPWDLAVLSDGSTRLSKLEPRKESAPSAVFFAAVYR
jgi:hypothetical protein